MEGGEEKKKKKRQQAQAPPSELRHFLLGYPLLVTFQGKEKRWRRGKSECKKLAESIRACSPEALKGSEPALTFHAFLSDKQSARDRPRRGVAGNEALSPLFSL